MTSVFYPSRRYSRWSLLCLTWPIIATAGISLDATRLIVMPTDQTKGARIGVMSEVASPSPYLVRVQVFRDVEGRQADVPFWVTPPVFRLEPGLTQQLRVFPKGVTFPSDRESLFYLRASALPASSAVASESPSHTRGQLVVATGNIIKLFYRPSGLPMTQREAMSRVQFTHTGTTLVVHNPTPYFLTLTSVLIHGQPVAIKATPGKNMLAPFAQTTYSSVPSQPGPITWRAINDYGGREEFTYADN